MSERIVRRPLLRLPAVAVAAALLAACAVGPDHTRPVLEVPPAYSSPKALDTAADVAPLPEPDAEFWRRFDDPVLDELVATALRENHDLRIALSRYDEARALAREADFDRIPTVTAHATASDSRSSADQLPGAPRSERDTEAYDVRLVAGWELDLFGRVRRNVESQRAAADAAVADLAAAQVAIVGEVVRTYVELRGAQERLRVASSNADNQRETLRIVEARLDAGRGTEFDTSRVRAQLETTLARIPSLTGAVEIAMHRLAVLSGRPPGAMVPALAPPTPLPALPAAVDAATPGDLLRRRPDVSAAEQRLHSATARIGVATADLFPRFTLGGLLGTQAVQTDALFGRDAETRLVALGVDWSFLDVGRVRSRIAAADAAASGALARYEQVVLFALEETESALTRYRRARVEDAHLERAALDSARAAGLARMRFDAGAIDLLDVLDAERTQLAAQDDFAAARVRSATALVDVYGALAGGWPVSEPRRGRVGAG